MSFKENWPWHLLAKIGGSPVPHDELLKDYWPSEDLWSIEPCNWRFWKLTWVYFCMFLIQYIPWICLLAIVWRWIDGDSKYSSFDYVFVGIMFILISFLIGVYIAWIEVVDVRNKRTASEKSRL